MKHALIINRLPLATTRYAELLGASWHVTVLSGEGESGPQTTHPRETHVWVDSLDASTTVELTTADIHARHPVDLIVTMSERDVLRAAHLRQWLRIPGQDLDSALAFRDKVDMKVRLRDAQIPVAQFRAAERVGDVLDLVNEVGFPVVIKPRRGAGSVGVQILNSVDDLDDFAAHHPALLSDDVADLVVERRVDHEMFHVDGVWSDGRPALLCTSTHGQTTALDFREGTGLMSVMLDDDDEWARRSRTLVEQVLRTLPTPDPSIFHAELFREGDDLLVNEIACRMGGAKVHRTLRSVHDRSMTEVYLGIVGGQIDRAVEIDRNGQAGWLVVPPRPGRVVALAKDCPVAGLEELRCAAAVGDELGSAEQSTDAMMSAVVIGASAAEVQSRLEQVRDWYLDGLVMAPGVGGEIA